MDFFITQNTICKNILINFRPAPFLVGIPGILYLNNFNAERFEQLFRINLVIAICV